MATIGRSRAVMETQRFRLAGMFAWLGWLLVHIYYLSGFKNRIFVLFSWAWSYLRFARGARLIVQKNWRSYPERPRSNGVQSPVDGDLVDNGTCSQRAYEGDSSTQSSA